MRPRRNRIIAAIVFAVTLLLGVSALAIAWRVQQQREVVPEEAEAYGSGGQGPVTNILRTEQTWFENHVHKQCIGFRNDLFCENVGDIKIYYDGPDLNITADATTFFHAPITRKDNDNPAGWNHRVPFCSFYQMDRIAGGGYDSGHWQAAHDAAGNYCGQVRDDKESPLQLGWRCFDKNLNTTYSEGWDGGDQGPSDSNWQYKNMDWPKCAACQGASFTWAGDNRSVNFSNVVAVNLDAYNNSKQIDYRFRIVNAGGTQLFESDVIPANQASPTIANFSNLSISCKSPVDAQWRDVGGTHKDDKTGEDINTEAMGLYNGAGNLGKGYTRGTQCTLSGTLNVASAVGTFNPAEAYTVEILVRGQNFVGSPWANYHELWQSPDWRIPGASGATSANVCRTTAEPAPLASEVSCLSKTADKEAVVVGDDVTFTINYANGGDGDEDTVFIRESTGELLGASYTNVRNMKVGETAYTGCTVADLTGNGCKLPALAAGQTQTFTFTATVDNLDALRNRAIIRYGDQGEETDPNDCSVTPTAVPPEAECRSKTISPTGQIDPGQSVTFTVNWANGPVAGTILVSDTVPNGFESVAVSSPATGCSVNGNAVSCQIAAAANATGSVTITATAKSNVRDLETTNTATVRVDTDGDGTPDDDADANNTCTTGTTVSEAGLVCESKTANPEGPVNPGDVVSYTVTYTVERGPADVPISETVPDYLTVLTDQGYVWCDEGEDPTADPTACDKDYGTQYDNALCEYDSTTRELSCTITEADTGTFQNTVTFFMQVDSDVPTDGTTIENTITVGEGGPEGGGSDCTETLEVEHVPPVCLYTTPNVMTVRVADLTDTSIELTTYGDVGTHSDLEFRWTATGGTLSDTDWHDSSGDPTGTFPNQEVADTVTWSPPTDASEDDTFDIKVYVRPEGSTDETGVSADECEATTTVTALDLICLYLTPNDPVGPFPLEMTFEADIGGDAGAEFTYDLDYGDGSTHYTGSGTVASGSTVELPYVPPQASPHTYDSTTPTSFSPSLVVTNTETGEESICPTVIGGTTVTDWTIDKDSDVDTCTPTNSQVTYTITVTNAGDYSADLENVRDTLDAKINMSTVTNVKECNAQGQSCTTYNVSDVVSGQTITWPGRTFSPGEVRLYSYTVTVSTPGDYYNVAEAIPVEGNIVRDDETFPTCQPGESPGVPTTGSLSSAAYAMILGLMLMMAGAYVYRTQTGAQVVANVLSNTKQGLWRLTHRKQAFERDAIRAVKRRKE